MKTPQNATQFAVIGIGRFGLSIVKTLSEYDVSILACDKDMDKLHDAAPYATHVVQADAADEEAMERLGLGNFDVVILAMGEDFESALLAAMKAKEAGAGHIVVKAFGHRQKKIFESIGVDHVVLPEQEMGAKTARRLVSPGLVDMLEDTGHFAVSELRPKDAWVDKTVRQADIRRRDGMTLLAIIRGKRTLIPVLPDMVIEKDDILVAISTINETQG